MADDDDDAGRMMPTVSKNADDHDNIMMFLSF
jgi:hypothetical protein